MSDLLCLRHSSKVLAPLSSIPLPLKFKHKSVSLCLRDSHKLLKPLKSAFPYKQLLEMSKTLRVLFSLSISPKLKALLAPRLLPSSDICSICLFSFIDSATKHPCSSSMFWRSRCSASIVALVRKKSAM